MAVQPTNKFKISTSIPLLNIDGKPLREALEGVERDVTLGVVLANALLSDVKPEGVTLNLLDRLTLARRFRAGKEAEIKVGTCEVVKKIASEAYKHAPLIAGQILEHLGDEPSADL